MAEKFSFFDPVQDENGLFDREYNAQEFTDYFATLVTTGVMKGAGNQLGVSADGASMQTKLNTGVAFVEGRYYANDSMLMHTLDTEVVGKDRIDRIVIRLDLSTEARYVKSFVKKGVASTNPVAPSLTQTANVYEISVAQVKVIGGQTFISASNVTDERGKDVICPWAGSNILPNFNDASLQELVGKVDQLENHRININANLVATNIYVDVANGTDAPGYGTKNGVNAFKTIQYAMNTIKKLNLGNVTVSIAMGVYNETVTIENFIGQTITFQFYNSTINALNIFNSNNIFVNQVTVKGQIRIVACQNFSISSSIRTAAYADNGISVSKSTGVLQDCTISNCTGTNVAGIYSTLNSLVYANNCAGTGNTVGMYANGSTITKGGGTITGTTATKADNGGRVNT